MAGSSILISVRVSTNIANRLESLAKVVDRSKSYLVAEAIEEYLTVHEWQVQTIQAGLKEIKQEKTIDFAQIKQNWETDSED